MPITSPSDDSDQPWPPGYEAVERLASGSESTVWRARRDGLEFVLRIVPWTGGRQARAELEALAELRESGVAQLVDHGALAPAHLFMAREWIEGVPLERWAVGRDARSIGALVANLAQRLGEIHDRGFAHGDVSPSNVVVAGDGSPVLLDFGLSGRIGSVSGGRAASGTWPAIAPERFAGGPPSVAADLFALGALVHFLVGPDRPDPADFYGRFPAASFLEAAGTPVESLPDWSRDLVESLVARHPEQRPRRARDVARSIRDRLDLGAEDPLPPSLAPPTELGRSGFLGWIVDRLEPAPREALALVVPDGDSPSALAAALGVRAAIAGVRLRLVDLDRELAAVCDSAAFDRWCEQVALDSGDAWIIAASSGGRAALAALAQVARARSIDGGSPRLLAVTTIGAKVPRDAWSIDHLPALPVRDLASFLRDRVDAGSEERLERMAHSALRAGGGGVRAVGEFLAEAVRAGLVVPVGDGWRLRPRALAELDRMAGTAPEPPVDRVQRALLAALDIVGGGATLPELNDLLPEATAGLDGALVALLESGAIERASGHLVAAQRWRAVDLVDDGVRRTIHRRRAERDRLLGRSGLETWSDRWLGGVDDRLDLAQEWRRSIARRWEAGAAEFALAELEAFERLAGLDVPPGFAAEKALCLARLGEVEQAERALEAAETGDAEATARVELARGQLARVRQDPAAARRHMERAAILDPTVELEASLGAVQLELDAGDYAAAIALADAAVGQSRDLDGEDRWRTRCDLARLGAIGRQRLGQVERARADLERWLGEAEDRDDRAAVGTLSMNLATLERRTGAQQRALELFERAARELRGCGQIASEATARAQYGGALREAGNPLAAERELERARTVRQRLDDRRGVATVRALRALSTADRGHLSASIHELERAAEGLLGGEQRTTGPLLEARLFLQLARVGRAGDGCEGAGAEAVADPRTYLDRARAAAILGDRAAALELLSRATDLAQRLGQVPVVAEAQFVARVLTGAGDIDEHGANGGLRDDVELWRAIDAGDRVELERLARHLEQHGRDDRAARAWLSLAATEVDSGAAAARQRAEDCFDRSAAGLTEPERVHLRLHLLSLPDPRPSDLEQPTVGTHDEDFEMEILDLLELNHRLVAQEDLDGLLTEIVDSACEVTGAERGFLVLEEGGRLQLDKATEFSRGGVESSDVSLSTSVVRSALDRMEPLNYSNAISDPDLASAPSVVEHELRSILCAPFQATSDLRGVVVVDHRLRTGAFGPRAERLLGLLADQAALAVGQLRRAEEIRELNRRLAERVARQEQDLNEARRVLRRRGVDTPIGGLVGSSEAMSRVRGLISRAAPSGLPVLLRGQSGTGKELAASAVHESSPRSDGPFVAENVAALPAALIESELFGYRKGAFTGADADREGLFARADGGTLFLDEIGEMPAELQAKLLRVLETKRVRMLGDSEELPVDFRLVTATHRDLEVAVAAGSFRQDLYYRIRGIEVELPSLAQRSSDIPELVEHFLTLEAAETGDRRQVAAPVLERLSRRSWPGNVRELRNEVRRLSVLCDGDLDDPEAVRGPSLAAPLLPASGPLPTMAEIERAAIERAIDEAGGDKREAARVLGISRAKIYQRLKEWRDDQGPQGSAGD